MLLIFFQQCSNNFSSKGYSCGGQVVSVFSFYSDDQSLNPAEAYSLFSVKFVFEKNENKQREAGLAYLKTSFSTVTRLATLVAEFSSVRKVASEKFNKLSLYLSLIAVVVVVVLF